MAEPEPRTAQSKLARLWKQLVATSSVFGSGKAALSSGSGAVCGAPATMSIIRKVSEEQLFVSEPSPHMFGNGRNEPENPLWTNGNWLKSRFHFSFAEYHNAANSKFGVLRVMNDDLVQPDRGFGAHPHSNMEIVTYIVNGELTHTDSRGHKETLGRGSIQFMSAGSGIVHSEQNLNKQEPVRFIQMWITPRDFNGKMQYGSYRGDRHARRNKWQHLVSDAKAAKKAPVTIGQDANIYVSEIREEGGALDFALAADRQAYLLVVEGAAEVDGASAAGKEHAALSQHAAAEVFGPAKVTVTAASPKTHLLLVEMAKDGSSRFGRIAQ